MKYIIGSLLTLSLLLNLYYILSLKEHVILVRGKSLDDKIVIKYKSISEPKWEHYFNDSSVRGYTGVEIIEITNSRAYVFMDNINMAFGGD